MRSVTLSVASDRLVKLMAHPPVKGLIELIWNALDADAESVVVSLEMSKAGGVDAIVVRDTGTGVSSLEAVAEFGQLGGSWKQTERLTRKNRRTVHGSNGQGRFTAFALGGDQICWERLRSSTESDSSRN